MAASPQDARGWAGREAVDADGGSAGTIVGEAGADWLEVQRAGGSGEMVLVPRAGAEPTGRALRLALTGEALLQAPAVADPGAPTDVERARLAAHYTRRTPPSSSRQQLPVDPARRHTIIAALRRAARWEHRAQRTFRALSSIGDLELEHDCTLQLQAIEEHLAHIERRLRVLGARSLPGGGRPVTRPRGAVPAVRAAEAFERAKAAFYAELETTARAAGFRATAALAAAHRADDEAMAQSLAGSIGRLGAPA